MKKTDDLKNKLVATFTKRNNWNKHIEIDGETYIYISAKSEIRREVHQQSGTIASLVGYFTFVGGENWMGNFMWCC